jgi:hypothetical protein
VQILFHNAYSVLFDLFKDITDSASLGLRLPWGFKPEHVSAPAPKDTTLPDAPPPEPQQLEACAGGEEQVEATNATPTDGTSKCLTSHG